MTDDDKLICEAWQAKSGEPHASEHFIGAAMLWLGERALGFKVESCENWCATWEVVFPDSVYVEDQNHDSLPVVLASAVLAVAKKQKE